MSSLKEIKVRLASVRNTQKITSAMKMVSSAKLHRTQAVIEHLLVYEDRLNAILSGILSAEEELSSQYTEVRDVKQVAVVAFSSNTGLCGAFNSNVWKGLSEQLRRYETEGIAVHIFPVGKKIADLLHNAGYQTDDRFLAIGDKPAYDDAVKLSAVLMDMYTDKQADRIELLYHHFKNTSQQVLSWKVFLPVALPEGDPMKAAHNYILEPQATKLLDLLLPKVLRLNAYATLLDTSTSEHAARMLAMQTANDNANDLIQELTLQYNKTRQQAITNELLDIMGGSSR